MRANVIAGVAAATLLGYADAFWRMPCGVIQTGRLDTVINPGTVSGHVHKISGPPSFNPNSDYDSLFNSRCTSCSVQADKSAYWTPLMYYQHSNGSFEEVPAGGMVVYYLGRGENASYIQPFPKGLKMISGNPFARGYDNSTYTFGGVNGVIYTGGHCQTGDETCVGGHFVNRTGTSSDPPGPVFTGRPVSDRVSFACLDSSPQPETPNLQSTSCANGLRAQIQFPSCWDGVNTYLPGNKHVDYMSQIDNGVCSPDFPVLLPHLFYEVLYGVANIKQDGGRFVFANGDPTGYGFHGDFQNGWDEGVLQDAVTQCINANPSGVIDYCAPLAASQDTNSGFNCPEQPAYFLESVKGMIGTSLPGCNKITSGPAPAAGSDLTCPPGTASPQVNSAWNGGSGSPPSNPAVGSVRNGYQYVGCFKDDASHSFSQAKTTADNMTNAGCQSFCSSKNMPLAATEYSTECYCGFSLDPSINPSTTCNNMICGGNSSEYCGGSRLLSVYNSTTYTNTSSSNAPTPNQDVGGGFTYLGCASEPASGGRALNMTSTSASNMTNDQCSSFCASKGLPLFGTEFGRECWCGNALASGAALGASGCTTTCAGAQPTTGPFASLANTCGGSSRLTLWNNTKIAATSNRASVASGGQTYTYKGCYNDGTGNGRALSKASYTPSDGQLTVEKCVSFCQSKGYSVAGAEYSDECYCGGTSDLASTTKTDEWNCNMQCGGDLGRWCGGPGALSVYSTS